MASEDKEEIKLAKVMRDFRRAYDWKKRFLDEAQEDYEFALGKQWEEKTFNELMEVGVRPLTINKIRPNINLLSGHESQNRSDFRAFPEGGEDSIVAEIATALLKNVMKNAHGDYKVSEAFESGNICGECFIEPYLDYSEEYTDPEDMLYGCLKLKLASYYQLFPEPGFSEYAMDDARYVCKITYDVAEDDLVALFPDKEDEIRAARGNGKINLDVIPGTTAPSGIAIQRKGYNDNPGAGVDADTEPLYDLLEYYYRKWVEKFYVTDPYLKKFKPAKNKAEADAYVSTANEGRAEQERAVVVKKLIPQIWICSVIGGMEEELESKPAWSFPKWKSYPFIPYFAYRTSIPLRENARQLGTQGIARSMKDLNRELNKRRTQELRILNTSANSGWMAEDMSVVDEDEWKKFGSTAGAFLKYKKGFNPPQKILPTPLSQGHAQLAAEHSSDIKESSGINADLLAVQEGGTDSGRAIAIRQKQGMVMVQKLFDNLSQTKRLLGRFILSQLSEIYNMDSAIKVLGESFLSENFSVPVMGPMMDPMSGQPILGPTGQPMMGPQVDPMTGQPQMEVDQKAVVQTFTKVLVDAELGKYDVSIGESANSETVRFGNYMTLMDMVQQGVPVPPDVIVDESLISQASKEKIRKAIENANAAAAAGGGKR